MHRVSGDGTGDRWAAECGGCGGGYVDGVAVARWGFGGDVGAGGGVGD